MTTGITMPELGHLMWQLIKLHRVHAHAVMEELGLHRGQNFVLSALWEEEGLMQSELAERILVQPATITASLQRMEAAGLIERRPDPHDQRVTRVYLTEAGRALEAPVKAAWRAFARRIFAGFTPDERAQLADLFHRIIENLARAEENH